MPLIAVDPAGRGERKWGRRRGREVETERERERRDGGREREGRKTVSDGEIERGKQRKREIEEDR